MLKWLCIVLINEISLVKGECRALKRFHDKKYHDVEQIIYGVQIFNKKKLIVFVAVLEKKRSFWGSKWTMTLCDKKSCPKPYKLKLSERNQI